jgi:hypothetical protein
MFEFASSFEQDLSLWNVSDKTIVNAFWGTQMPDPYYPVGCDVSVCRGESSSDVHEYAFFDEWELWREMRKYTEMGQVGWAQSDCYGLPCHSYYGYANFLT